MSGVNPSQQLLLIAKHVLQHRCLPQRVLLTKHVMIRLRAIVNEASQVKFRPKEAVRPNHELVPSSSTRHLMPIDAKTNPHGQIRDTSHT